jgi:mannitol 2-dehydrogenase
MVLSMRGATATIRWRSSNRAIFGDLVDDSRFVAAYRSALTSLHERGARATLESLR